MKSVFHSRISRPLAKSFATKSVIPCSFSPSVKGLTKVERFQQLERRNKFLQRRKYYFLVNFFRRRRRISGVENGLNAQQIRGKCGETQRRLQIAALAYSSACKQMSKYVNEEVEVNMMEWAFSQFWGLYIRCPKAARGGLYIKGV
jgi:hypothetical protein